MSKQITLTNCSGSLLGWAVFQEAIGYLRIVAIQIVSLTKPTFELLISNITFSWRYTLVKKTMTTKKVVGRKHWQNDSLKTSSFVLWGSNRAALSSYMHHACIWKSYWRYLRSCQAKWEIWRKKWCLPILFLLCLEKFKNLKDKKWKVWTDNVG